jgi:hypothetical protein
MDDIMPFGRYQGYTVEEIVKDKPEYINWLMENTSLKFYQSVHDEVSRVALSIINAYKPRRNSYIYDGGLRGELAHYEAELESIINDWEYDVPF